jgi:hypothetical protein
MLHLIFYVLMGFLAFGSVLVMFASVIGLVVWMAMKLAGRNE